jgi:hypothetical protein
MPDQKPKSRYLKDWPQCPACIGTVKPTSMRKPQDQAPGEIVTHHCQWCSASFTIQRLVRYTTRPTGD